MDVFSKLKGYQQWGQVLGVIAKLNWFSDNNYLYGFCQNYNYNFEEISTFLKVSNSIIEGDSNLYGDLKSEYRNIKSVDKWSQSELDILNLSLIHI